MNKKAMIVGAVLAIAAAAAAYQFFFKSMKEQAASQLFFNGCACTLVGGTPRWSGSPPCPPNGVSFSQCPYP
jgi:hypothetical protein